MTSGRRIAGAPTGVLVAGALAALAVAACAGRHPGPGYDVAASERPIEMFCWMERIGDADPLGALAAEHHKHYPGDVIINARAALSGLARKALRNRMLHDEPPDTFQANVGDDLMQWVLSNGSDAHESKLLPLDDLVPGAASWRAAMPTRLVDHVSYDGKIYGVPADVYRSNTVFYSKQVFAKYGLAEPRTISDLLALGDKLRGTGVPLIAVGSREPWTVALLMFESLLVAREGPDVYRDYFGGRLTADDPRVLRTLEAGLALFRFVNPDHRDLSWLQAVDLVTHSEAAMTVMGDWARSAFLAAGLSLGKDYGEIPFPGSADTFVFTADGFTLPVDAKNQAGAQRLLGVLGSREGQQAIAQARGTLAARIDVPPPAGDPVLAANFDLLRRGRLVIALSGLVPPVFADDLNAALAEMLEQHDVDPVVHMLRSRYVLLQ